MGVVSPGWGIAASTALPALDVAIGRWKQLQANRTVRALEAAADESELSPDELMDRLVADERRLSLLAAALNGAANTALDNKVEALGRSLGALAVDDARIQPETI